MARKGAVVKIAVHVTVEMDEQQLARYCDVYGLGRDEVRDDVKEYVLTAVQNTPAFDDGHATVTAR